MKIITGLLMRTLLIAMILITLLMFSGSVAAKEIAVDDDGDADFISIQAAIDKANNGDTILVYPGTYSENVDVNKELTIIAASEDPYDTIVRPDDPNDHVFHVTANNVTISGFTVTEGCYGIYLYNVQHNRISNNRLLNNTGGIELWQSCNNDLSNNIVNSNKGPGIHLFYSCNNNDLIDNTVYANIIGIDLLNSSNNVLKNNEIFNNTYNFGVRIVDRDETMQNDIDTSNSVDGRTIYYLVNTSDVTIDGDSNAATVYCINCQNITIKDQILKDNRYGICLYNTSNSLLKNNTLSNNHVGIILGASSNNNSLRTNNVDLNNMIGIALDSSINNEIINNTANLNIFVGIDLDEANNNRFSNNTVNRNDYGINLDSSENNVLEGNIIVGNSRGLSIDRSNNNEIHGNILLNNSEGLRLPDSNNNTIYNNYFNNTNNIRSNNVRFYYNNSWSIKRTDGMNIVGGHYLGGNFWADPYGTGFSQTNNDSNDDGFCDSPYTIGDDSDDIVDQLPLFSRSFVVNMTDYETTLRAKVIMVGAQSADDTQRTDDTHTKETPSFSSLLATIAFTIAFIFIRKEQK
nr:NosD domain-containing protein [uncultured Methanolobus sp.]